MTIPTQQTTRTPSKPQPQPKDNKQLGH